ncbi:MAG: hypothetical protein A3C93_03840 [Candidatus Lloydbacteria bacterium RIFCSPHIGHO2_02_FULL_54_17]|uniref:Putative pre-16S rRNA nuclease n=1 Tax=Candidatus Lloydbacteria bacterium RIFCSPHIGHO2_02_FULL_54_17 TaxID=1798664 RepID=A0A1G2DH74_9BACT|nr:MAG: hypothetical protein A2762_00250 [Candidatus Lloydbacteria bacterium RIFCSPHIGHO2_01_FULL_54_11]OGZ13005.1 MAG: hypothetical protein A3C93_03840 [Candidatus Lloydbacteria bacterium RIFCSPHIGHO2_02_FULL_54_17]OGZ15112.1 MAG: hypothetical protein A3H76_00425 [Candidatus Lloydbacteria bacterium RIFCSPLOWO2_02_FULL_54_12]OGZ15240.1 MAG: hypothetical protein A2948_05520 [Candidatus Lloydbacteria bacterium RIFCSPLOWO2_01_FULL_54_18]
MKYLCVDYGTKRVGIATSDSEGRMAFPLRVIPHTKILSETVASICRDEGVEVIVLGESRDFSGKPNPVMRKAALFAEELKKETGLSVELMPEVLSSREAARMTGTGKTNDASAAAIVLQSYLDKVNGLRGDLNNE